MYIPPFFQWFFTGFFLRVYFLWKIKILPSPSPYPNEPIILNVIRVIPKSLQKSKRVYCSKSCRKKEHVILWDYSKTNTFPVTFRIRSNLLNWIKKKTVGSADGSTIVVNGKSERWVINGDFFNTYILACIKWYDKSLQTKFTFLLGTR